MKIVCVSDPHGQLPEIPPCELLLISGDICPATDHHVYFQLDWLDTTFRYWLMNAPAKRIVGVAGNHDYAFQHAPSQIPKLPWVYLENATYEWEGLKIYGSPWQLWFYDWAFNAPRIAGEEFLAKVYQKIEPETDIIITHGPPWGGHPQHMQDSDLTQGFRGQPQEHVGSKALLDRMKVIHPRVVVTGHIHGGHGCYDVQLSEDESKESWPCFVANASVMDEKYRPAYDPIIFEWDNDQKIMSYEGVIREPKGVL